MVKNKSQLRIHTSVEQLWQTLTDPSQVKLWQYGSDLTTGWQVGEPIRFRTAWNDTVFEQWGTVLAFQPPEFLSYSLFAPRPGLDDRPEHYFTMSYHLTPQGGSVDLEILQEDNRPGAVQEAPQGEENPVLAGLKALAEGSASNPVAGISTASR